MGVIILPRLTMRLHGASASIPRLPDGDKVVRPVMRRDNIGWTMGVARRNAQFLQRIDFDRMPGVPYSLTFTVPVAAMSRVTPEAMHRWIDSMLKYLGRRGMLGFHWVIEFTASHMPHIHMTVWLDAEYEIWNRHTKCYERRVNDLGEVTMNAVGQWLALTHAAGIRTMGSAQDVQRLDGHSAWLAYVAKHTQRGVAHYQRALSSMPVNWVTKPGAMWGHSRGIPLADEIHVPMDMRSFHRFRRAVRQWCCARAARVGDPKRRGRAIRQARRMLRCTDGRLSPVRPISVWIPGDVVSVICEGLRRQGCLIGEDALEWAQTECSRMECEGGDPRRLLSLLCSIEEMKRS